MVIYVAVSLLNEESEPKKKRLHRHFSNENITYDAEKHTTYSMRELEWDGRASSRFMTIFSVFSKCLWHSAIACLLFCSCSRLSASSTASTLLLAARWDSDCMTWTPTKIINNRSQFTFRSFFRRISYFIHFQFFFRFFSLLILVHLCTIRFPFCFFFFVSTFTLARSVFFDFVSEFCLFVLPLCVIFVFSSEDALFCVC